MKSIDATHVVLIQGDEPLLSPEDLNQMTRYMKNNPDHEIVNAISNIECSSDLDDDSQVKCAINEKGRILYCFRRSPSYCSIDRQLSYIKKMLGLIGYRREVLDIISNKKQSHIQELESIEQLWLISNNININSIRLNECVPSVNVFDDIIKVNNFIEQNIYQQNIIAKTINFDQSLYNNQDNSSNL